MANLYVCATPLGNLGDITLRTIECLRSVDCIAAEDTRRTLTLLNHLDIKKPLLSLHQHNEQQKSGPLIERLQSGQKVALVSDAGLPGISDPGEILIQKAIAAGLEVTVLPGPCALVTALAGSGLPTHSFSFHGFLDRRSKERKKYLREIAGRADTQIFYEAPHRIGAALADLLEVFGNRRCVIARELSKKFEEYIRTDLQEALSPARLSSYRGEMVLLVEGACGAQEVLLSKEEALRRLLQLQEQGVTLSQAARELSQETGIRKNTLYQWAIEKEEADV